METKICINCKVDKPLSQYHVHARSSDGKRNDCKACHKKTGLAYKRTRRGHIVQMYAHQKYNAKAKTKGGGVPNYTREQLEAWIMAQPKFEELFIAWEKNSFSKWKAPSCNRLDDYKPYRLDNLELVPWIVNKQKYSEDTKSGKNTKGCKAVDQLGLEGSFIKTYFSMAEATRVTGVNTSHISAVLSKKSNRVTAGGFKWRKSADQGPITQISINFTDDKTTWLPPASKKSRNM